VAIPLRTKDYTQDLRYRNRGIGYDNLRRVIGYLLERPDPHIDLMNGVNSRWVTRIRATPSLISLLSEGDEQNDSTGSAPGAIILDNNSNNSFLSITGRITLSYQSIVHTGSGDCIRLKGPKVKDDENPDDPAKALLTDYEDTVETEVMRSTVLRILHLNRTYHFSV
jgi:hypothetical protein